MEPTAWRLDFPTHLPAIDAQHARLEAMLQGFQRLVPGDAPLAEVLAAFEELVRYSRLHFDDEVKLMREARVDARHLDHHHAQHEVFFEEMQLLSRGVAHLRRPGERLLQVMVGWFSVHVPTLDDAMGRQVQLIQSGWDPARAWAAVCQTSAAAPRVPVRVVEEMLAALFQQNRELVEEGAALERRVEQRTRELKRANQALAHGQEELRAMLQRVDEAHAQMVQSEKLAALGQLAAGVAHEINNPVAWVDSNLKVLGSYLSRLLALVEQYEAHPPGDPAAAQAWARARQALEVDLIRDDAASLLTESQDGVDRVRRTVGQLKEFAHADDGAFVPTDLNAAVETTLGVTWNLLKYKATVERCLGPVPPVRCLPAQVRQVLMNLLMNAAQALDSFGVITVRTGAEPGWAWMEVQDTGAGMTPEVQRRIFEPFFTTRPVGQGTGLGLSLAWDVVVKRHGGHLDVSSAPGKGSTFRVWLPVEGREPAVPVPHASAPTPLPQRGAVRVDQQLS